MNVIRRTNKKLLRLFRPQPEPQTEPTPVNPQPGPKIGQELDDFEQYLENYLNRWRAGTQERM